MFVVSKLIGVGTMDAPKRPAVWDYTKGPTRGSIGAKVVIEVSDGFSDYRFPVVPSASPTLEEYCEAIIAAADLRTQTKIAEGVTFAGHTFSLSLQAQSNWTNLFISRNSLAYPLEVSTADDGAYSFANAAEVATFYGAGIAVVKSHLDAGRAIKLAAAAATTPEELDAIELE